MTGRAVDLAAVRSVRTALAAIVATYPELTGATARARLAANLPEIIAMKPLDPNATGAARTITVRLSADLIEPLLDPMIRSSKLGKSDEHHVAVVAHPGAVLRMQSANLVQGELQNRCHGRCSLRTSCRRCSS